MLRVKIPNEDDDEGGGGGGKETGLVLSEFSVDHATRVSVLTATASDHRLTTMTYPVR